MTFIEFIAFIISLVGLTILTARRGRQEANRKKHPELYDLERTPRALRETLRSMNLTLEQQKEDDDEEEDEPRRVVPQRQQPSLPRKIPGYKPPPRLVHSDYALQFRLNKFKQLNAIEKRRLASPIATRHISRQVYSQDMAPELLIDPYSLTRTLKVGRGETLIRRLGSLRDVIVLHEIISKPKSLLGPHFKRPL